MKTVAIVHYGMGNLDSVRRALEECGAKAFPTSDPARLAGADALVLPGVGSFAQGMSNLRARGLEEPLRSLVVEQRRPVLGICLGMQLMASQGFEDRPSPGLGWIDGDVVRLAPVHGERIPHVGWNDVESDTCHPLLEGLPVKPSFYFVHSFHLQCKNESDVVARTPYCGQFVSAVGRGNILGVQFHPEKSQRAGMGLLRNFLAMV